MQIVGFIASDNKNKKCKEINVDVNKVLLQGAIVGVTMYKGLDGGIVYASTVTEGVQPIITVLKDLAEPVSYGFMIKGFMQYMSGKEHEGLKVIKCAVGGYVGVQWIPMIFKVIKSVTF